jgi:hypothetical protein
LTNLVALSSQTHRMLRVNVAQMIRDQAKVNIVGVVPREFQRLVAHYPIFFTKNPDVDQFEPVALLGFPQGQNLYFSNGAWDVTYVPLQIQRHPFALAQRAANPAAGVAAALDIAIDLDNPNVQSELGERLFLDDGKPSKFLQDMSGLLSALVSGSTEAYAFTAKLTELNLLEPVRIDIAFVDRSETKLQGLYWIATKTLKALPAIQLAELRDLDYLEWIYFQMASLAQVPELVARKNRRDAGPSAGQGGSNDDVGPR